MTLGRLHVIVDAGTNLAAVLDGGAPVIQVRLKAGTDRARFESVSAAAAACASRGITCLVNDRADFAAAAHADGVHLGADDLPVRAARAVLGEDAIVGGTARDAQTARQLAGEGATYLGVGPIYPTASKSGLPDPIGLDTLRTIVDAVDVPVIAISGITVERVPEVLGAGAHGVAVIGAIAGSDDPRRATEAFVAALERFG